MIISYIHDSQLMWAKWLYFFGICAVMFWVLRWVDRGLIWLENKYYEHKRREKTIPADLTPEQQAEEDAWWRAIK